MLTTFNEIDMTEAIALRERYREDFEKKHGARLGFMSLFVKAAIVALKELPAVNGEIDGDDIVYKNHYDIGVAVSTEQGLVVPVVRDADRMSFAEIEQAIAALARKARDGKLTIEDLSGGTFTITNGGVYGSLMSTPILNPPQSGILGMHKIARRPVAVGDKVEIRPMMYVALSYDHRLVDGREAVTFPRAHRGMRRGALANIVRRLSTVVGMASGPSPTPRSTAGCAVSRPSHCPSKSMIPAAAQEGEASKARAEQGERGGFWDWLRYRGSNCPVARVRQSLGNVVGTAKGGITKFVAEQKIASKCPEIVCIN